MGWIGAPNTEYDEMSFSIPLPRGIKRVSREKYEKSWGNTGGKSTLGKEDSERVELARYVIGTLPKDQRRIVESRIYDELPFGVIATKYGISKERAEALYREGTQKVRDDVELDMVIHHLLQHPWPSVPTHRHDVSHINS